MSVVSEKKKSPRTGLLGTLNEKMGLGEGVSTSVPRLQPMGPLGLTSLADMLLTDKREAEVGNQSQASQAGMNRTARMGKGRTKAGIFGGEAGGYGK